MPPPDPNNPIIIPAPKTELPPPKDVEPGEGESSGTSDGGAPRLKWEGNSPVQASPPKPTPPAPPPQEGTGTDQPAPGPGEHAEAPSEPSPPVDRRVVISITGRNTSNVPQYFSKLSLNLQGNKKLLSTLLAAAKFVLGQSDSQEEVEVTMQASSGVAEMSLSLDSRVLSPHMTVCDVVLTPKTGKAITVPPGGTITVSAKGVSGAKSSKYYKVIVTESWINAQGVRTPGAVDQFKAEVAFQLS